MLPIKPLRKRFTFDVGYPPAETPSAETPWDHVISGVIANSDNSGGADVDSELPWITLTNVRIIESNVTVGMNVSSWFSPTVAGLIPFTFVDCTKYIIFAV